MRPDASAARPTVALASVVLPYVTDATPEVGEVVRIARLGVAVDGLGRGIRPGVQLISRGIRPRARRSTDW
jgi:hypothetical protein